MTKLVFIDTETDGVHPGRVAWEIGMICRAEGVTEEMSFFVDIDLSSADPFGLKIGRFYDRHPRGRWLSGLDEVLADDVMARPASAAAAVARWTHGAILVGAVPNFDTETLAPLLRQHGLTPAWHYHLVDVETLGRRREEAHPAVVLRCRPGALRAHLRREGPAHRTRRRPDGEGPLRRDPGRGEVHMSLLDRFRLWAAKRQVAREARQADRCARGLHHWQHEMDRVACFGPGCGKRYGQ
jgi:hypothetical protein